MSRDGQRSQQALLVDMSRDGTAVTPGSAGRHELCFTIDDEKILKSLAACQTYIIVIRISKVKQTGVNGFHQALKHVI